MGDRFIQRPGHASPSPEPSVHFFQQLPSANASSTSLNLRSSQTRRTFSNATTSDLSSSAPLPFTVSNSPASPPGSPTLSTLSASPPHHLNASSPHGRGGIRFMSFMQHRSNSEQSIQSTRSAAAAVPTSPTSPSALSPPYMMPTASTSASTLAPAPTSAPILMSRSGSTKSVGRNPVALINRNSSSKNVRHHSSASEVLSHSSGSREKDARRTSSSGALPSSGKSVSAYFETTTHAQLVHQESVKETNVMVRDYDPQTGRKMINNYMILKEIGRGVHGKVKLVKDVDTGEEWAIKVVEKHARRRLRLSMSHRQQENEGAATANPHLEKIRREIAILKKCNHPHVVRIKEVIDDPAAEKIYLVLEYLPGGDIKWHDDSDPPRPVMTPFEARRIFRDIICGVEYLHYQGIVHRDIKPANLLWTADARIKISDFGVSVFLGPESESGSHTPRVAGTLSKNDIELAKTAGSPAFFAPELCGVADDDMFESYSNLIERRPSSSRKRTQRRAVSVDSARDVAGVVAFDVAPSEGRRTSTDIRRTSADGGSSSSVVSWFGSQMSSEPRESILVKKSSGGPEHLRQHIAQKSAQQQQMQERNSVVIGNPPSTPPPSSPTPPPPQVRGVSMTRQKSHTGQLLLQHSALSIGKAIDVWAMGVTLYCMVFGQVPFIAETEFELFQVICKSPLEFPEGIAVHPQLIDLFVRLLEKDPLKRITLPEIKLHPWVTADMSIAERDRWLRETDPSVQFGAPMTVTEEELRAAVNLVAIIRNSFRKISSSFQNLAMNLKGGRRRRTKSMPSVPVDVLKKHAAVERGRPDTRPQQQQQQQQQQRTPPQILTRQISGKISPQQSVTTIGSKTDTITLVSVPIPAGGQPPLPPFPQTPTPPRASAPVIQPLIPQRATHSLSPATQLQPRFPLQQQHKVAKFDGVNTFSDEEDSGDGYASGSSGRKRELPEVVVVGEEEVDVDEDEEEEAGDVGVVAEEARIRAWAAMND